MLFIAIHTLLCSPSSTLLNFSKRPSFMIDIIASRGVTNDVRHDAGTLVTKLLAGSTTKRLIGLQSDVRKEIMTRLSQEQPNALFDPSIMRFISQQNRVI